MPPRPINMESSREQYVHGCRDPEQEFGTISSTSLQLMDGITLRHLARLPDDAAHLHPFSRSLDPVARPIIAFLRRNCTSHLSRRQNNSICLLPKLMEIIFILCCQLERSTDAYKKRPRQKPNIRDKWGCVDSNTSPSSAETTRDGYPPRIPHTSSRDGAWTNLLNRCAWWLSGVHESTGKRSHRLFAQVKVLLLSPGPMCQVKAGYLRFLACRFFPELPAIYLPLSESSGASATAEGQRKESSELGGGYVYIPSVSNDTTTLKKCLVDMSEGRDICLYRYG
uniref:Uncharacterized protein n=1 Tax=Trypanosoma congolense (strain IL3000) TaxID=1068625 RepID=G0UXZ2_TRYCI|nr:conserved hypothetical protein [Trypanosoma congolense IL3000]